MSLYVFIFLNLIAHGPHGPYPGAAFPTQGYPTLLSVVVPVPQLKEVRHVRSLFPETWLWRNATVG